MTLVILISIIFLLDALYILIMMSRNRKLQKEWDKEKAMCLKMKPAITKAQLCEYYVMFCMRNDCKVDF